MTSGDGVVAVDHVTRVTAPGNTPTVGAATATSEHLGLVRLAVTTPLVVIAGLSVAVVARNVEPYSYASTSGTTALADLAAGVGMIGAGAHWLASERRLVVGVVTALAGVAWLSSDWIGWHDGPALARSTAMVVAPFLLAFVVHLGVALPGGSIRGRLATASVLGCYGVTAAVSLGWALWRDPFFDPNCWSNCTDNSFLLHAEPSVARAVTSFWLVFTVVAGTALVATIASRLGHASATARRQLTAVLTAAAVAVAVKMTHAGAQIADGAEHPRRHLFRAIYSVQALTLVALAAAIVWTVGRRGHVRRSLARLATDLGAAPLPGALRAALAQTLGDRSLEVAYWLPEAQRYVDADGGPVEPDPNPARALTSIERDGQPVALVVHDRSLQQTHDLEHEIGAASRLVVDNERLRAQALAQLAELRESRARIVKTADDTRRRLERNLHDGAQQRLLALSYALQRAGRAARLDRDEGRAAVLSRAIIETMEALEELRDLANGIFPSILADSGLGPALVSYADVAPLRVELAGIPDSRFDAKVETAAYLTVVEAATHAYGHGVRRVCATFTVEDDRLRIEVTAPGLDADRDALIDLADRLGALRGRLDLSAAGIEAVIPCG